MEGHVIMKRNGIERWVPTDRVDAKKAEGFKVVGQQPTPQPEPVQAQPVGRQARASAAREAVEE